jgi:hypothetical protein
MKKQPVKEYRGKNLVFCTSYVRCVTHDEIADVIG